MSTYGGRRQHRNSHGSAYLPGGRTETVRVPTKSCGLIVGKGGRNIKELQRMPGIQHISVDFASGTVKIVGNDEGIRAAKHRIDQAVVVALNSDGYFPDATLTCLLLKNYSAIEFQRVSRTREYVVRTDQLDANRQYFSIKAVDTGIDECFSSLVVAESLKGDTQEGQLELVAGFDPSEYMPFFDTVIRSNLLDISGPSVRVSIGVNFGKTFVSSVPEDKQGTTLTMAQIQQIGYGKRGMRPEFVRNFPLDKRPSLLRSLKGEYEELFSGKHIVVHCVSQKTKKRYNIKLCVKDNNLDANPSSDAIKQIASAETYFSILGVPTNASSRQIKIAFRRKAREIHPDKNADPSAGKAMVILNEAWECLKDDAQRADYSRLTAAEQKPRNSFKYSSISSEPFPDVERFHSIGRRLALCTVLKETSQSEFRTTIETAKDEAINQSVLRKLQKAWEERGCDGKMRFPDGTDDWLIVETVRYTKREALTNGTFILTVDEATEDNFGKTCEGIHISIESYDIMDTLESLQSSADKDGIASRLLAYLRDFQNEARRISSLLDNC